MSMEWEPKRKGRPNYEVDDSQEIGPTYVDRYVIIFGKTVITHYFIPEYGGKLPTFEEVVEYAEEEGYDQDEQSLYLVVEAMLYGIVFAYGRYSEKFWEVYGQTKGLA